MSGDEQNEFVVRYGDRRGRKGDKGDKGDAGEQGETGKRGLPRGQARAVVFFFVLTCALAAANLLFTVHYVRDQQAAQRQAGQIVGQKICTTLGKLAALKPPAGDPATNPSRAYEQELHVTLDQLGPDIGCK